MAKLEATLVVPTAEGISLELPVAGAGTRFLAGVFDAIIIGLGLFGLLLLLNAFGSTETGIFATVFITGGIVLLVMVYFALFHHFNGGQTPGKSIMGVRVVKEDGTAPGFDSLALRAMIMIIDVLPVPLCLGVIAIAVTPKRQRLGDLMTGTLLVRQPKNRGAAKEPFRQERWSELAEPRLGLTSADINRFEREDLRLLRDVITRRDMNIELRERQVQRTASVYWERLGRVGHPDFDERDMIQELYLFLREHQDLLT